MHSETNDAPAACAATCPLARIPETVWKEVFRRPWRRRHPLLFWGAVLLLLGAMAWLGPALWGEQPLVHQPRIALVTVSGPIMSSEALLEWIRSVGDNRDVKGVLLRVDSPGGGAAASQELYQALRDLARKMPLAVSMGSVAASGGLMVSMAGTRVFANASTVTGSIGVRMDIPQVRGLLDKLGLGQETLTTAPYKDAASYMHPPTPEERAYLQHVLEDMHRQFVEIIAEGRHLDTERVTALADGKILTGREALRLGLVDALGGQDAALRWLAEQCGVPASRKLLTRPNQDTWLQRTGMLGMEALGRAAQRLEAPAFLYQF